MTKRENYWIHSPKRFNTSDGDTRCCALFRNAAAISERADGRQASREGRSASGDLGHMRTARAAVQVAKVALGERGPIW